MYDGSTLLLVKISTLFIQFESEFLDDLSDRGDFKRNSFMWVVSDFVALASTPRDM